MKTISTLFTSLFFAATVFAANPNHQSVITVKSASQREIQVVIDGKIFSPGKNIVIVGDVAPGYHSVTVYRKGKTGYYNADFEQVYTASIAVKPATDVQITIGRRGRTDVAYEKRMANDDDWAYDRPATPSYPANEHGRWEDNKSYNSYASSMSDREFDRVMNSMQKEWFENNRMKSASYIISNNFFTADQVRDMLSVFSFENNKLEIAKQAYTKTVDKQNYDCVLNALEYKSSKIELARFIRSCE
jgi:hypothetical protein